MGISASPREFEAEEFIPLKLNFILILVGIWTINGNQPTAYRAT